jgi:hypothetical protein
MLSESTFVPVPSIRLATLFTRPNEARFVVQDFVSFPESLEWELGRAYLSACGNKGFIQDSSPIPYAINNNHPLQGWDLRLV